MTWPCWHPLTVQSFVTLTLPTPQWLIPGLIPGDGWTLCAGALKIGKSIFMAQCGDALSQGIPFLSWPAPTHPMAVLYVQADAPPGDWQTQLRRIIPQSSMHTMRVAHGMLDHPAACQRTAEICTQYAIIIWDALEKLTVAYDLNTQLGAARAIHSLKHASAGRPFVLIHHLRKSRPAESDSIRDSIAGHHYLGTDASQILSLTSSGVSCLGRLIPESQYSFARGPHGQWCMVEHLGRLHAVSPA